MENRVNLSCTEKDGILYPNLQISNDPKADRPLGRYGRMALEYLKEQQPDRYTALKMDGSLMEIMRRVQEEAAERIETLMQQLLQQDPLPVNPDTGLPTEDTLERARHLNSLKRQAEETALLEIVLIPR